MLWGTRNRPPDWCQPAPSHTTTACAPSAICVLISLRCSDIASALTLGMMIAAPTLRAWQMAPNRYAESWRLSRTMGGREPTGAQMYSRLPFWPTRASSLHEGSVVNASISLPPGSDIRDRVVVEAGAVFSLSCSCCVTLHAVGPLIDPSP